MKIKKYIYHIVFLAFFLVFQVGLNVRADVVTPFSDELPSENYYLSFQAGLSDSPGGGRLRAGGNMGGDNDNKMVPAGEPGTGVLLFIVLAFLAGKRNK